MQITRAVGGNPDIAAKGAKGKLFYLKGAATPPLPQEAAWKDTVMALPGQVTRFVVRWAPTDLLRIL
jgi:FtsP/CotA-like multicopper oxidase with cupredoxin domain